MSLLSAAKSALRSLVDGWLTDLKQAGIRVNMLSTTSSTVPEQPASVTPNGEHIFSVLKKRWQFEQYGPRCQIGKTAAFLASDASR
jgi:NAD(P)-dependent dehydrogenase (short-subunit alcohol dehydrogenase family)